MMNAGSRQQQIEQFYAAHNQQLVRAVARRSGADAQTVQDACSIAWTELLTHRAVELTPPWRALGWLTQVGVRAAWQTRRKDHAAPVEHDTLDRLAERHSRVSATIEELAEQHARLDLVRELPERPRRFLLRLMLGYTYAEIAAQEGVSATTTNKQIAKAKRLLRELEARENTSVGGEHGRAGA